METAPGVRLAHGARFWWDRAPSAPADGDRLGAVIFDLDSAMAEIDRDGDVVSRTGLLDTVMSLFVAGVWVGVVSTARRDVAQPMVRQLLGDGLVETLVTVDDLPDPNRRAAELFELAMWELGIAPQRALAVVGSSASLRAAAECGLPAVAISPADARAGFGGAVAVRSGYDGSVPLLAAECERVHRRSTSVRQSCQALVSALSR